MIEDLAIFHDGFLAQARFRIRQNAGFQFVGASGAYGCFSGMAARICGPFTLCPMRPPRQPPAEIKSNPGRMCPPELLFSFCSQRRANGSSLARIYKRENIFEERREMPIRIDQTFVLKEGASK